MISGIVAGGSRRTAVAPSRPYGNLIMLLAGPDEGNVVHTDTTKPEWAELYGKTINVGVFAAQRTKPWDSGVLPSKVIEDFALSDVLDFWAYSWGSSGGGAYVGFDLEFLTSTNAVVAALGVRAPSASSVTFLYGPNLLNMAAPSVSSSTPLVAGKFSFVNGGVYWTPNPVYANHTPAAFFFAANMSSVARMRISNARVSISASGSFATVGRVKRLAA